jgi:hypothetical protein
MYKGKYLKYKTKYLDLKSQLGSGNELLKKIEDEDYSFITWTFADNNNKLTISYNDTESAYHLIIDFKQSSKLKLKYGKKNYLKSVNLVNLDDVYNLPYIVCYILHHLIESIGFFRKIIDRNDGEKDYNYNKRIVGIKELYKKLQDFKEELLQVYKFVQIKFNNKIKQLEAILLDEQKIVINFNEKEIYESDVLPDNLVANKDITDVVLLNKLYKFDYYKSSSINILINICIWLLELDDNKRKLFGKSMIPSVNFIDNDLKNKVEILTLLKQCSTQMRKRLDTDYLNRIYYTTVSKKPEQE